MTKKNYEICINLSTSKINLAVFNLVDNRLSFNIDYNFENTNEKTINFLEFSNIIEKKILEIEKNIDQFLNDIFLMVDTDDSFPVSLSIIKDIDNKVLEKKDILYMIENAKQQILRSYFDKKVIHIIVKNYTVDDVSYEHFPENTVCKKITLDIQFICLPKKLILSLEEILKKNQISINKIVCTRYVSSIINSPITICDSGMKIINGFNNKEVMMVPKKIEKKGFFEQLFHFFN